jgi:hypothetical protein
MPKKGRPFKTGKRLKKIQGYIKPDNHEFLRARKVVTKKEWGELIDEATESLIGTGKYGTPKSEKNEPTEPEEVSAEDEVL